MRPESTHQVSPKPKLLDLVQSAIQTRHYSRRTGKTYRNWIKQFILFHNKTHPLNLGERDVNRFLTYLATERNVSASTQNQALSAILFLYKNVLQKELGDFGNVVRAKRSRKIPVVFSREEIRQIFSHLQGNKKLMAQLLYGAGLRLTECLRLRVQDIDFDQAIVIVRNGKGEKDRITLLPEKLTPALSNHIRKVKNLHIRDLSDGNGSTTLPYALSKIYPNADKEFRWQFVFPSVS